MPPELVLKINKAAEKEFCSRSAYIRMAVIQQLSVEDHLEQAVISPQSYFNTIKKASFAQNARRRWNKLKYSDIDWDG